MAEDRAETLVTNIGESVVSTFDFVWNRLTARLSDLADDEYFWEPAGGCWSLRRDRTGSGAWTAAKARDPNRTLRP